MLRPLGTGLANIQLHCILQNANVCRVLQINLFTIQIQKRAEDLNSLKRW